MKHTKEEIINALKVIKDECKEAESCLNCPFGNLERECLVQEGHVPEDWEINEEPPETWRALK
jgi:hypothetical protein